MTCALLAACSPRTGGDEPPADAGLGGTGGGGGVGGSAGAKSFELPASLDLGGDTSAVAVGDVDADGYPDLAALMLAGGGAKLVVAWGDADSPFAERSEQTLAASAAVAESLGTSQSVVVLADVSADGAIDVVTASGVWRALGPRSFEWHSFGDEALSAFSPVAVIDRGAGPEVVRGSTFGNVETCDGVCTPLPGQPAPCASPSDCPITDLTAADFDGDGHLDLLAGGAAAPSLMWSSYEGFKVPTVVDDVAALDFQSGDIDRDGVPDLVARASGLTRVWLASPGGVAAFFSTQSIQTAYSNPGASALADANSDGCLDLIQVGVGESELAVRLGSSEGQGCAEQIGTHDPAAANDTGWTTVPGVAGAVGVQQLDVNGDMVPDWIVRTGSKAPSLHFLTIAAL